MRRPIIAGNWKLNKTLAEGAALVRGLVEAAEGRRDVEVVVCPPFTALAAVAEAARGGPVAVGAQDVFWKDWGAYTGEIGPAMLLDAGATWVIIGHSERRGRFGVAESGVPAEALLVFGDTDASVHLKTRAALDHGLTPIVCCGEAPDERRAGDTDRVIRGQLERGLGGLPGHAADRLVIAYEPVWAIGTGEVCEAIEANRVCGLIRASLADQFDEAAAAAIRILYGGSVKPDNAADLLSRSEIDGALVGGASLKAEDFIAILNAAPRRV